MAKKGQINESNAKLLIAFLIVLLGFAVFILFNANKDTILASDNLKGLVTLIVVGMGLLIGLLYLVNAKPSRKR